MIISDSKLAGLDKWFTVSTPYGYAKVDAEKFKTQLEQDASKSSELRNVILEYVKEKELTLQLELEAKEKKEKEEEEKKAKE